MDTQNLLGEGIDVSKIIPKETEEKKETRRPFFISTVAVILILISLVLHYFLIFEVTDIIKNKGGEFLFSVLIPDCEISEPLLPQFPDSVQMKDPVKEDKPKKLQIYDTDLSTKNEYGLALTNETSYTPDLYYLLGCDRLTKTKDEISSLYGDGSPMVLIYHTHATEAYCDHMGTSFRSEDNEENVVAVGGVICDVLNRAGIGTIHLTEQFDREDWNESYENSHKRVLELLNKYPSIQYVFDVHRDCIGSDDDGYARTVSKVYGRDTAQLMFVCGTDEGGSSHTEWRDNLSFALKLQSIIFSESTSVMRPVNLRRASFYQDTSPASLILECGTCACTLSEAKRGAVIFACALAQYITDGNSSLDEKELIESICP